jgi:hypothetical protein
MSVTVDNRTSGGPVDGAICIVHRMLGFHEMRICLSALQRPVGERWIDVNVEGTGVAHQRNAAARTALQAGAKRIVFIDDDHVFASNALMRLLAWDTPIVGGIYLTRKPNYFLTAMRKNTHDTRYTSLHPSEISGPDLVEVDGIGMGFTAIRREVFEAIDPDLEHATWFEMGYFGRDGQDEDFCLCAKAQLKGFKIFADPTLRIPHLAIKAIVPSDDGAVILTEPKQAVQIAMAYTPTVAAPVPAEAVLESVEA